MLSIKNSEEVLLDIANRAKVRRLALNFTQCGLAKRSGVSLGSLKRFEHTGEISLRSLLKLALVLDCLTDFEKIFHEKREYKSLDEVLATQQRRQRGVLK